MAPAIPLSDLASAEFEARLDAAQAQLPEAEARAFNVARPDGGLATAANAWGQVAWWSRQLGLPREVSQAATVNQAEWLIRRIEWIDAAGPPFRRKATDWEGALRTAIISGKRELEHRVLAVPVDLADGSLGPTRKAFAEGLRALVTGDDEVLHAAAADAGKVPDDTIVQAKWYPRIGPALQALLDRDGEHLSEELNAICAQHLIFATKGHLRLSEGAWIIPPVVQLLIFARRRALDVDVDPKYHAQTLRMRVGYVHEWEGQPVGRDATVEAIVDPVPVDQLG